MICIKSFSEDMITLDCKINDTWRVMYVSARFYAFINILLCVIVNAPANQVVLIIPL